MLSMKKDQKIAFVYIKCSFKNTLITVTNFNREPILQISSKAFNKKVKRRNTPYILYEISLLLVKKLKILNYTTLNIIIQGIGAGRYNIVKHLRKFKINTIEDRTYIPFNGCRPKKEKRR